VALSAARPPATQGKSVADGTLPDRIERLIDHLAEYADPSRIPPAAHSAAKKFVFDSIGVALAGSSVPQSAQLLAAVARWGEGQHVRVWGQDTAFPAPSAAMVNAFHIHNQEFDCVHERAVVHPMAVILAALMAVAEREKGISGARMLGALVLAVDVATTIGMCATLPIRFFRPAMCGSLGATAGMAVLTGLSRGAIRDALGIAYSQLAGTMQAHVEGTPTLALQVGFAARGAVSAIDLAREGFRGPHRILDGQHGYFALFEQGAAEPDPAFAELGRVWQIERVSHKPFPTGRAAHGGIAGLRELKRRHQFSADEVAEVTLSAPPLIRQLVDRPMQADMSVNYARLCLPYLAAVTLLYDTVSLDAYRADVFDDPRLAALAARVRIVPDGNTNVNTLVPQHLRVRLSNGDVHELAMPHVFGAPDAPMSIHDQHEKFQDCCRHAKHRLSDVEIHQLIEAIDHLEQFDDVARLIDLTIPRFKNT
jgi:aconitate decarboxylase